MVVASKNSDVINADSADKSSSSPPPPMPALGGSSSVPCSICFDLVIDDGERSIAKLNCGHKFHLDCIGSAFNSKGTMQCPNCRKVESGRWLFADGSAHAISESVEPDWMSNEGPHDLNHFERPFGIHWCPIRGLTLISSDEDPDPSSISLTNSRGNQAIINERTAAALYSGGSYIIRPSDHVGSSNIHHLLNSHSAPRNTVPSTNIQHPGWGWNCHFLPYNANRDYNDLGNLLPVNPTIPRSSHTRAQADAVARSPSFLHPLQYTQQPVPRTGESSAANSQSRERIQILPRNYHQEQPSEITNMPSSANAFRRFGVMPPVGPSQPHHHHHGGGGGGGGGSYVHESERDAPIIRGSSHHQFSRGSDSSSQDHRSGRSSC